MRVKLREKLLERRRADGEHERLIAVIAGTEITAPERARHRQLRDLFTVAEDPELRLAGENFLAADEAGLTAAVRDAVVVEDALASELRACLFGLLGCGQ